MTVIQFIIDHQTILCGFGIAILDLAFALDNGLQANGILHSIYLMLSKDKDAGPK